MKSVTKIEHGKTYSLNPLNMYDQLTKGKGASMIYEEFKVLDCIPSQRKDRMNEYLISSFGRVFDLKTKTDDGEYLEIKPEKYNSRGIDRERVSLYLQMGGYKKYDINYLVALAFCQDVETARYCRDIPYVKDKNPNNHIYTNIVLINKTERAVMTMGKGESDEKVIRRMLRKNYDEKEIKRFLNSDLVKRKVTLKQIREVKKDMK